MEQKYRQLPIWTLNKKAVDEVGLIKRLQRPTGPVDIVLDSDMYNEVDDQFTLVYILKNADRLNLKAVYAAPFDWEPRSHDARDGMEKSYAEVKHMLSLLGREDLGGIVFKGCDSFLKSEKEPVISDAARDLAARAMLYTPDKPLYVAAIGAITDIASAILINPEIVDRIVVLWLGGNRLDWPDAYEFNLYQDVAAARVVFDSGCALVMFPCGGVVSEFAVSRQKLEYWLKGKSALCDYLLKETIDATLRLSDLPTYAKILWDVTVIGWLLPGEYVYDRLEHAPIPEYDYQWGIDPTRHFVKYVYKINRENLLLDLFSKVTAE